MKTYSHQIRGKFSRCVCTCNGAIAPLILGALHRSARSDSIITFKVVNVKSFALLTLKPLSFRLNFITCLFITSILTWNYVTPSHQLGGCVRILWHRGSLIFTFCFCFVTCDVNNGRKNLKFSTQPSTWMHISNMHIPKSTLRDLC